MILGILRNIYNQIDFFLYRLYTIIYSLFVLYTLSDERIEKFLDSYDVYNFDWLNEEQMVKELGENYYRKIQDKVLDWYFVLNHLCAIGRSIFIVRKSFHSIFECIC